MLTMDRTRLKLVTAVALCVLAGAFVAYELLAGADPLAEVPDREDLRSAWACVACGEVFWLTPREVVDWQRRPPRSPGGASRPPAPDRPDGERRLPAGRAPVAIDGEEAESTSEDTSIRTLRMTCPRCGKPAVERAPVCPHCRIAFAPFRDSQPQVCPHCGWDPRSPQHAERKAQPPPSRSRPGERRARPAQPRDRQEPPVERPSRPGESRP